MISNESSKNTHLYNSAWRHERVAIVDDWVGAVRRLLRQHKLVDARPVQISHLCKSCQRFTKTPCHCNVVVVLICLCHTVTISHCLKNCHYHCQRFKKTLCYCHVLIVPIFLCLKNRHCHESWLMRILKMYSSYVRPDWPYAILEVNFQVTEVEIMISPQISPLWMHERNLFELSFDEWWILKLMPSIVTRPPKIVVNSDCGVHFILGPSSIASYQWRWCRHINVICVIWCWGKFRFLHWLTSICK